MRARSILLLSAGVAGAGLLGAAGMSAALSDPASDVEPIVMADVASAGQTPGSAGTPSAGTGITLQAVDGLEQLVGTLRSGDEPDDWYVSGVEVDFGPDGWIAAAPVFDDYDGDGTAEPLLDELRGLDGRTVTLGVRYEIDDDRDRDDADAFTIEGLGFRDPTGGQAPWQNTPTGTEASREEVSSAAASAVGQGSTVVEIDRESDDGWRGWDVEVRGADGRLYQAYLDPAGTVVDVRPYND